jgi:hypothetical protein
MPKYSRPFPQVGSCAATGFLGLVTQAWSCEITLCRDGESFDVHPLAGHRCVQRVGIARLQIVRPLSLREWLAGVRASMLENQIPDGCKCRTDNHPVLDLPSIDGTQLLLNHLAVSHDITR